MIVLGLDPGLEGALCILRSGDRPVIVDVIPIPTTGEGPKRRVDAKAVIGFLERHSPDHAFIERAGAMPKQGVASGFRYGRAVGALEAIVEGLEIPLTMVQPSVWKRSLGLLKASKEDSRQRAIQLFTRELFPRKKDHNRAEAALIAYFGLLSLGVRRDEAA